MASGPPAEGVSLLMASVEVNKEPKGVSYERFFYKMLEYSLSSVRLFSPTRTAANKVATYIKTTGHRQLASSRHAGTAGLQESPCVGVPG